MMKKELIGIVGLGTIGLKLAEYLAEKGFDVVAYNYRGIESKSLRFCASIEKKVKYDKLTLDDLGIIKKVSFTESLDDLCQCDIVVDALCENYQIKKDYYKKLLTVLKSDAVLASSTSSLSLERLALDFDSERFVGIHFFNPPTKMTLIELAFLPKAHLELRNRVYTFLAKLDDKKVIEMPAIQGYIVNRILFVYINYAIEYMSETGLDSQSIDEAMKAGINVPMGPLELSDYIGNDITLEILNELFTSLGDIRFRPAKKLKELVLNGNLGRKTSSGFHTY